MTGRRAALGVLLLSVGCVACEPPGGPVVGEFRSPNGTYTVRLFGRLNTPPIPVIEHRVRAQLSKGQTLLVPGYLIHSGDWFDRSWEVNYDASEWVAEQVLRFKRRAEVTGAGGDEVVIDNSSQRSIQFLRVISSDLFLCFELAPGAVQRLRATAQAPETDLSWISGDGLWADGTPIPFKGVNFLLPVSPRAPNARYSYLVRVTPTGIDIREVAHGVRPYQGN